MRIEQNILTYTSSGEPILLFRLVNSTEASVELTNWGARWIGAYVPDKNGTLANVIAGPNNPEEYLTDDYYMGAIIGRYANRIAQASIVIEGKKYRLEKNDGQNSNHGGWSGFHHKVWGWEMINDGVRFILISPEGEGGYPGNISVAVEYLWNEQNELTINYHATTDRATYLNLTNHTYFNLSGTKCKIDDHRLMIPATEILETRDDFIPTGRKIDVHGTPFDFTCEKSIGTDLHSNNAQIRWNRGYNHCYILNESNSLEMIEAVRLLEPTSRRTLHVATDLPAVLLYTAGYYIYPDTAVCFETQYYPDTPSHPHFPSCLLLPGQKYRHSTIFGFGVTQV